VVDVDAFGRDVHGLQGLTLPSGPGHLSSSVHIPPSGQPCRQLYRLGDPDRADLRTGLTGSALRPGTNLKQYFSRCPVDVPLADS
jgi:hypothetical protein